MVKRYLTERVTVPQMVIACTVVMLLVAAFPVPRARAQSDRCYYFNCRPPGWPRDLYCSYRCRPLPPAPPPCDRYSRERGWC